MNTNQSEKPLINKKELSENNLLIETNEKKDPVGRLINRIVLKSLQKEAAEIYFEPESDHLNVIFHQYGICLSSIKPLNKAVSKALFNRLKTLANIENDNSKSLKEGYFSKKIQDYQFNFWLNIVPTLHGEKAILRWWNNTKLKLELQELIYNQEIRILTEKLLNKSQGVVLVIGENNSGKSTTLYSLINAKSNIGVNVATIENRIKYNLPEINQTEISRSNDFDYEKAIDNFVSDKVESILVNHLSEEEKIKMASLAVEKNLFVLTSLNANNPYSALEKLLFPSESSTIINNLNGIINQRLLRKLCPYCRIEYKSSEVELNRFGISEKLRHNLYLANNTQDNSCPYCQGVGYRGQIPIYEVLEIDNEIKNTILQKGEFEDLKEFFEQHNVNDLLNYALNLVIAGETTFSEIERVLSDILNKKTEIEKENNVNELVKHEEKNEDIKDVRDNKKNKDDIDEEEVVDIVLNSEAIKQIKLEIKHELFKKIGKIREDLQRRYSVKLNKLEEELESKYYQRFLELEKAIRDKYSTKISILEEKIENLTSLYSQSKPKTKKKFASTSSHLKQPKKEVKPVAKIDDIEELKNYTYWHNLSQEIEESFEANSSAENNSINQEIDLEINSENVSEFSDGKEDEEFVNLDENDFNNNLDENNFDNVSEESDIQKNTTSSLEGKKNIPDPW